MTFKILKPASTLKLSLAGLCLAASVLVFAPNAEAGNACACGTTVTPQRFEGVTVYRGPATAYDYKRSERKRMHEERLQRADKARQAKIRSKARQNAKLDRIETKVDALSQKSTKSTRNTGRFGRSYRGNSRFFGRNGFIGNSNFSGATIPLGRKFARRPIRPQHSAKYAPKQH